MLYMLILCILFLYQQKSSNLSLSILYARIYNYGIWTKLYELCNYMYNTTDIVIRCVGVLLTHNKHLSFMK